MMVSECLSLSLVCYPLVSFPCRPDGSYSEHGREIFDEEAAPQPGGQEQSGGRQQSGGKRKHNVAKPGSIKAMVMGMGGVARKRKEVGV